MNMVSEEVMAELENKVEFNDELDYKEKRALQKPQKNPRKPRPIVETHIREVRESLGISAYELVRICGVSDGNLNKFERNMVNVTLSQLMMIAKALGVSLDSLVYGLENNEVDKNSKELIELRLLKKNMQRLLAE